MKIRHVVVGLVMMLVQGCNCSGPNPTDGGTDSGVDLLPDGGTCVGAGQPCRSDFPCCGGACAGSVCTTSSFCRSPGGPCATSTDCCNNRCVGGQCASAGCTQVGAVCTAATDCCSGICNGTCQAVPGQTCKVLGEACTSGGTVLSDGGVSPGGCCSTRCQGGVCQKAYYCQPNGDLCHSNAECCGQLCSVNDGGAGVCIFSTGGGGGGCIQEGNPCSGGSNCCSRICFDPGAGATVCLPAGGCRLTGTSCTSDSACCGGGVNPNGTVQCRAPGRCDNGNACNGVGNICKEARLPDGGMVQINASTNCCNGGPGNGLAVCKLDNSGIPRCYGGHGSNCPTGYTGQAGCCIATGDVCQFREQCCNGALCLPGDGGVLRCGSGVACTPLGGTCATGNDCCNGTLCVGNVCRPFFEGGGDGGTSGGDGGTLCTANGSACQFSAQCCSLICQNNVCSPPVTCQPTGGTCTTSGDCCSGLACQINGTTGTCQPGSCIGSGQTCTAGSTSCCVGLSCVDSNYVTCSGSGQCTCTAVLN